MRAYNERLVLSLIRQSGALPKASIAKMTGLSAQTVSVIMRSLEADGLLQKGEPVRGKVGQPSVPMDLTGAGAYFFGLKVGRRGVDLILTDFLGRVVQQVSKKYRFPTPDGVVAFANTAIGQMLDDLPEGGRDRVSGLGIAMPFRLWDWVRQFSVDYGEMSGWRDRTISDEIGKNWDFPVLLSNDASAACGAELVFGDQEKPRDFLYFFVGYFVGGGMVLDNVLYTGRTGNAAALGSMPIAGLGDSPRQLVDAASLAALETALQSGGYDGDMIWEAPGSWDLPEDVLDSWLVEAAAGLALTVLSSACVIDFECVVVDGWLPVTVRTKLVARINHQLGEISLAGIEAPSVREGTIGPDARSLGAASLPLSERFLVDRNAFLKG
ncbi:ROK family transcriptional regulator [Shimia sp.]|uniref:ROK family transcriptional regulator n=1 Tax=Shimia sp. TaxID=1954381 RepID=UPI0032988673